MKTLLLATLLFCAPVFAELPKVKAPFCKNGNMYYDNKRHQYMDICITDFKASSPAECDAKYAALLAQSKTKAQLFVDNFFINRQKSLCGK